MTKGERQITSIEAAVMLRRSDARGVGRDRVRLLQAVAREGSITAGAKAVGLTYKAAWDALEAMSNLFGRPLLETRTGGRRGGGAHLTPAGVQVVEAFERLESEMARVLRVIEPDLVGSGISPRSLVSGYFMRTSARNALRGRITDIRSDELNAEVSVAVAEGNTVHALVTNESVRELGLCVGREALVLIKAPFVMIAPGHEAPKLSARNCLCGIVKRSHAGTLNAEVTLDIGGDKTIAAMITAASAKALDLKPGSPACALFDAGHVIIAID
jgi:molybdate transport system regulatory protein